MADTAWHDVAFTRAGELYRLHLDGQLEGSVFLPELRAHAASALPLVLGRGFHGALDELRLHRDVDFPSPLRVSYRFGASPGTEDTSGNSLNSTRFGAANWTSSGRTGGGLSLGGTTADYISVPGGWTPAPQDLAPRFISNPFDHQRTRKFARR